MSIISINNLTFSYGEGDYIFKDASFVLDSDWRLGFVGRNGRGKTTFLRLLMEQLEYRGSISSSVNFDYFPFEVGDKSQLVVDIASEIVQDLQLWRLQKELNLLEVAEDRLYMPFELLSGGEQSKVLLAMLLIKENNFLLIDEPTNHLDAEARIVVSKYLSNKKGFILVSHDRAFLDEATDHTLSINRTGIDVVKGNFSTWLDVKEKQDSFERAQNEKLHGEIGRLKAAAKRKSDWSDRTEKEKIGNGPCDRGFIGHKAAKVMKTAKVIERRQNSAIDEKSKLLKNIETPWELKLTPLKHHSNRLVELRDLSLFYGEKQICDGINLTIEQGDRIALCGKNGCGKTSILKLLLEMGERPKRDNFAKIPLLTTGNSTQAFSQNAAMLRQADITAVSENTVNTGQNNTVNYAKQPLRYSGSAWFAPNLKISYVSQDTSFLRGNLRDFAEDKNLDETLFKVILSKLDFPSAQFDKDMGAYSAGQKKKVLLAASLSEQAHLYIWDEPLNFVDIISRIQIESLLKDYAPTMLFVEHDKVFVSEIATKILKM